MRYRTRMAQRPTFFLSSTIHDFRDLRSAIKFSLEERGCRVLASEFNDFGGTLDQHSYEACLTNIERADYFVLLIGARVGGWYDSQKRVSITQQEYRVAYELHQKGKLRLVSFVRDEVWQLRQDRKELAHYLQNLALNEREQRLISQAPSTFANDADFVSRFVTEVGRNLETSLAVSKGRTKPTGNWIHRFRDYRDIHDVLHPLAFTGLTSNEAAYRTALEHELLFVASKLLEKREDTVRDPRPTLKSCIEAHPLTIEARDQGEIVMELETWNRLGSVCMFASIRGGFAPVVITHALTSTIFMKYDRQLGAYSQTAAYDALTKLFQEIALFDEMATSENLAVFAQTSPRALGRSDGPIVLDAYKVAAVYSLAHRWINILDLCLALAAHVRGKPFVQPNLMPFSPVVGLEEQIKASRVTVEELRQALGF